MDGPTLGDISYAPPEGLTESVLTETRETVEEFEKLRVTEAKVEREGDKMIIYAVPYVKPKEEVLDQYDTNSRGYASLNSVPAMVFQNLDDRLMALITAFVPYAVANEEGGYTDNATKTISPLDRLKALTLPDPDDVADDLARYMDAVERAEELDERIEETDELIDEVVYELYGLTDEEIEVVEETVGD
jgi:hypothetical protein